MITEKLIDFFFGITSKLFGLLPDITWTVDTNAASYLRDALDMICYLLPINTVKAIGALVLGISIFRAWMALIRLIREFLSFI